MRAAITAALEALAAGAVDEAEGFLVSALEDGPPPACTCLTCGLRFDSPGLLDHHRRYTHRTELETTTRNAS